MAILHDHLGFGTRRSALRGRVYLPRYYNPEIDDRLAQLEATHDLVSVGRLINDGHVKAATGDEIGKMAYGTGTIPFVRTSDIANWEIKADAKQGVSEEIYDRYARKQDVRPGDLLMVRDGTYLIGVACMVTEAEGRMLYQSHILKFRVADTSPISAALLLALFSSPIVRRQIKAKQFTADIIDSLGNRYTELMLPVPKDQVTKDRVHQEVMDVVGTRIAMRERIRRIPLWLQGIIPDMDTSPPAVEVSDEATIRNMGFSIKHSQLKPRTFIPRYYDPGIQAQLQALEATHDLYRLGDLERDGMLSFGTGAEPGKMAYGTGDIPFVRTSDLVNWEMKGDPKQSLSEDIYDQYKAKASAVAGDLLVVRDGTYLVGSSAIVTEHDGKMIYCGGLYRIRTKKPEQLDPYLLLAALNTPIVRTQMRSKQFTRDVIDTMGKRLYEVVIPIPKDLGLRAEIARVTKETVEKRAELRNQAKRIAIEVEGIQRVDPETEELLEDL